MKKIIGFVFNFDYRNWMGGTNYMINLLKAINLNNKNYKIIIFTGLPIKNLPIELKKYNIVKLEILKKNKINIIINYLRILTLILFKKDLILENILKKHNIDVLSHSFFLGSKSRIKSIFWIPDLQEIYLKKNFSLRARFRRFFYNYLSTYHSTNILFSSHAMKKLFLKNYKCNESKIKVLKFIPSIPKKISKPKKIKIKKKYFFISNQFWKHKNYDLVVDALIHLKKKNIKPYIYSTGHKKDWRFENYYEKLIKKIKINDIKNFKILGTLNRNEQIYLMKNAMAIINPSQSEGWNTAIEEAKLLKNKILASRI